MRDKHLSRKAEAMLIAFSIYIMLLFVFPSVTAKADGTSVGLKVAGVDVTTENCGNIITRKENRDAFFYDVDTKTLTIKKNATYEGGTLIVNTGVEGLTINVAGNYSVKSKALLSSSGKSVNITGGGKLTLDCTNTFQISMMYSGTLRVKDITLENCYITGNGHTSTKLVVENANINAFNGIKNFGSDIELKECVLSMKI